MRARRGVCSFSGTSRPMARIFLRKLRLSSARLEHGFVEVLELRERELRRQQLEADRLVAHLAAQPLDARSPGSRRDRRPAPAGSATGNQPRSLASLAPVAGMLGELDQRVVRHADHALARIAIDRAEGVELLEEDIVRPVSSASSRRAASSSVSSTRTKPPGSAHLPLNGASPRWISRTFSSRFIEAEDDAIDGERGARIFVGVGHGQVVMEEFRAVLNFANSAATSSCRARRFFHSAGMLWQAVTRAASRRRRCRWCRCRCRDSRP